VRLTVDGVTTTQPLVVEMDPRVKTPRAGLEQQFALSMQVYNRLRELDSASGARSPLRTLLDILQTADAAPTEQVVAAVAEALRVKP
jgi:hypothetical protein